MTKKQIVPPTHAAPMPQVAHAEAPAPHHAEPHPIVTSPAAENETEVGFSSVASAGAVVPRAGSIR